MLKYTAKLDSYGDQFPKRRIVNMKTNVRHFVITLL